MIYVNHKNRFKINNPYALLMIVRALLELECALSLEDSTETEFDSVNSVKNSLKDEIDTNDPIIISMFGNVLNELGDNLTTVKQVRKKMKEVIKLMEDPQEQDLLYLKKFCLHLGKEFHSFGTTYVSR